MKNQFRGISISLGITILSFALLAGCKGTFTSPTLAIATPTITNTPCALCTPTFTKTPVPPTFTYTPVPAVPTATPTPNATTIPMGLVVVADFTNSVMDYGLGFPITLTVTLFTISVNHAVEDTATCSITTPLDGTIALSWLQDANMGTYWVSQYSSYASYNYVPNSVYSCDVSTSIGTAHATMNAPGGINFSANGSSVTATYPGNYDAANVSRISPSPVTTYANTPGVSVGSPFVFPGSAYSSPSLPATFGTVYTAAMTITTFTGTGSAQGAFVGNQLVMKQFTR